MALYKSVSLHSHPIRSCSLICLSRMDSINQTKRCRKTNIIPTTTDFKGL